MNRNSELQTWRTAWKAPGPVKVVSQFNIHEEGRRQERTLRIRHGLELGVAVMLIVYAGLVLRRNFSTEMLIWALIVWAITLTATAFSVWNWRLLWRASSQSISEYVVIYQRRSLATLRAVRFGFWLLVIENLIVVPWLTWDFRRGTMPASKFWLGMCLLALITTGLLSMLLYFRKRAFSELIQVQVFQASFTDQD